MPGCYKEHTSVDYPLKPAVPVLFEAQALKTPSRVALRCGAQSMTYAELNVYSNQLARYLCRAGVGVEHLVGTGIPRSLEAVVAILGILKSGAAYVPLDENLPNTRIAEIVQHTQLEIVVDRDLSNAPRYGQAKVVSLNEHWSEIRRESRENLQSPVCLDNLAYVMYTSGSTGIPKAVAGIHGSIVNGLEAMPVGSDMAAECWCLNLSLSFGASVSRLFLPLLSGIPLVILPTTQTADVRVLADQIEAEQITNVFFVTPLLREILRSGETVVAKLQKLRTIGIGGSPATPEFIEECRKKLPFAELLNGYAVSEVGGAVLVWRRSTGDAFTLPNTEIYVLDEEMNPVPSGHIGELFVGAGHLARGYWHNPKSTAEIFLPDLFNRRRGGRLYRTGDIGRLTGSGNIEVLGRLDDQVKIRGFRVHATEIEDVLGSHEAVLESAVRAEPDEGENRLIAYVVTAPDKRVTVSDLRRHLAQRLPEYMIPGSFVLLTHRLPRNANGKLDMSALPKSLNLRPDTTHPYSPPRSDVEKQLTQIWTDILNVRPIGIEDTFVELGGHSLTAIQVIARIWDIFEIDVSLDMLLGTASVRDLAEEIARLKAGGA